MTAPVPIFDGHNDVLLRLWGKHPDPVRGFLDGGTGGQLDLPRASAGGFAGGLFAVFVPSPGERQRMQDLMQGLRYDVPLPPPLATADALPAALAMSANLLRIAAASGDRVRVCRSAADIRSAMAAGKLAAVLHFEGAEAIDDAFDSLELFHAAGLRSLGPVWSRPTAYAQGVPFRFPATPDIGDGLTEAGRALVKACNRLRIMIDLSHLNAAGVRDVANLSDAPLVATHSNAHALCPHARNLTDDQLAMIRASGGMVGVNFATCFLREDGQMNTDTPLETVVRHVEYLLEKLGPAGVGLGSDFDGAMIPRDIGDAAGLPRLVAALRARGYDGDLLERLCWRNWVDVLERTWGG